MKLFLNVNNTFVLQFYTMKSAFFAILFITLFANSSFAQSSIKTDKVTLKDSIIPVKVNWKTPINLDGVFTNWVVKNKNKTLDGYRIQLYNGVRKEAENFKIKFLKSKIQLKSYVIFETPEFKTQVGDFRTQLEAEKWLIEVRKYIPGAFIVETQIYLPEIDLPSKEK